MANYQAAQLPAPMKGSLVKFALNYSPQAVDLLQQGRITLDRFKCPPWPEVIAAARPFRPVAVHFELRAGAAVPPVVDWDEIAAFAADTATPTINLHLGARQAEFPDIPPDSTDPAHRERIAAALVRDVQAAVERFGPERVIVENVPYHADRGEVLRAAVEPEVITHVVAETGCGLLLDVSHGVIAARYLGWPEREYLAALPVGRLRELHITGIQQREGRLQDHLALSDEDWAICGWALDNIALGEWPAPWLVAFEYGGVGPLFEWRSETGVIAAQAPRLAGMVRQAALHLRHSAQQV
ncbi:MAG: DUF692 family protein [Anaerolineae bacterium]|nr:DUF692 family protein [Anaerolineae bacterium]